ncbi:hypothetical protein BDV95DRAFT_386648 [Massariosphaeria phaeospora]|uniref:Uncharacterized protein n=1 Tax=Massariosphaeria phaeospora TaxID=100035 RepID=A0A7C8I7D9_9PLEO|nr:hypothetical protein BDV95DRAFT_386648 [Massariosphaeria phaeospora]
MEAERPPARYAAAKPSHLPPKTTGATAKQSGPAAPVSKSRPRNTKRISPAKPRKSVSVAAVFKSSHRGEKRPGNPHRVPAKSSSRSPQKSASGHKRKRADVHPLAKEFKETTNTYRKHIYEDATSKITRTYQHLLASLTEATLQPVSSPADRNDPLGPPLKLTLPGKLDRATRSLYESTNVLLVAARTTNEHGEEVRLKMPFGDYTDRFVAESTKTSEELDALETQWEATVNEIWKVGTAVLGEDTMREMLFSAPQQPPSPGAESTLFIPEFGSDDATLVPARPAKKRVSFQELGPELLARPSKYQPLPIAPVIVGDEIKELQGVIAALGVDQIAELKQLEAEHQKWWNKKHQEIARALRDD